MSSLYEKSQGTKIQITSAPATLDTIGAATWLDLHCTIKEVQFTGGQKQDIDVTTLCSTEQENINGLGAQSEISMSGNFYVNPAQDALREAYDNDTTYGFRIVFPSGIGFQFLSEVRQHTWSSGTNSVVAATFSLRLKGKPTKIDNALRLTTDLPDTKSVTSGSALSLTVVAAGGTAPYSYAWKKGGNAVSGQGGREGGRKEGRKKRRKERKGGKKEERKAIFMFIFMDIFCRINQILQRPCLEKAQR